MEIDANISDVLREVIAFLECLRDAQLPLTLENLREKLLARSRETLSVTTMTRGSPEPYLDMNSGPKSLLLRKNEADSEEYVGMEESKKQNHQDYYETFQNEEQIVTQDECPEQNDDETDEGQTLIRIYKNLSAAQIKSKCHKCGPLYKKEEKKLFLSESRACWIALVGSHLLIYRSERHNRPYAIYPIRGYMARPAPNLIPRDRQKSESAFEMYRPGNETLRFIARTPKDMDQWITKICEVGCAKNAKNKAETRRKRRTFVTESLISPDEITIRYRDAGESIIVDRPTAKGESACNKDEEIEQIRDRIGSPPPLPARIPRRLPSLPPDDDTIPSYRAAVEDDDDDDDIYHKIEDLRNGTRYQNMILSRKQRADEKHEVVAYDDVRAPDKSNNEGEMRKERSCDAILSEETYDDIVVLSRINAINANSERQNHDRPIVDGEKECEDLYDDVENLVSNEKFAKDRTKDQTEISSKSPQKKSFLNRVLSRKESPGKSDKKYKGKASSSPPPSLTKEEMSTYDDASDLTPNRESSADEGEELSEYNCPPPPRPVYTKSTTLNGLDQTKEFYDDVSVYKNQQTSLRSMQESGVKTTVRKEITGNANMGLEANNDPFREDIEHYQSPRSDLCIHDTADQRNEILYDDIALWVDFTARQRDISGKRDANEDATKSTINSDKRSWNRFTVNRKSRASDSVETNRRSGANECEEIEDSSEGNGAAKRNTFQKLISRMENSLAKVSARGNPSSLPTGKSSTVSNNS
ncbi:uncharacterized protein LOC115239235 isoform X1 [Formica exsecta]|uniref:uncharacterized protein LOC115239235 isoform X1 n=1 Tax=Formica exsecta TaxID=72781 RepID=UPI001143ED99|nr:uncharacterized protein LOC115239235 isoform X1 [Formica exsecta]XP_029669505.1 uncharacterized protein LOC115239235 isoform X1 [Formica exsecta]XP_029669506.1 uncharacterized protein LOC115239235 isoform X1 [Formica exsecta]XP_029669507.1 uncharacterized protein LOC115239235 isoform X1 [Formica exsecta]XP_029669508.1 uncharacterized protein LOC115239235 isoform X1 [Formica exsecta]